MSKQDNINLLEFQKKFATEEACHEYLFKLKWPEGYHCPKCGNTFAYETKTRRLKLYECTKCRYQATVTVKTVMEKSRTDLKIWFWAIYLISNDKRGISANMLSHQLGISYKTAWLMLHKIRHAMGDRDSRYLLTGIIELDDVFFGAPTEGGKCGRGTEKTKVLVGLSLSQQGHPLHLKMVVVEDFKGSTLNDFAHRAIKPGSVVSTDMYSSYKSLAKEGYHHEPKEFNVKDNPDHLNWLHIIVSNAKAFIGGTYHGLDAKHLQAYFDEFCYRFNRRSFKSELFNRLLNCCVTCSSITFSELTA